MSAVKTMAFSTTDWVAFCFLGTSVQWAVSATDWCASSAVPSCLLHSLASSSA